MPLPDVEAFLRRIMTDAAYCRRFLDDPEAAVDESELSTDERWAVLEAIGDGPESGVEFLDLLRTRLAVIGIHIGRPPASLTRVFATEQEPEPPAGRTRSEG